MDHTYIAEQSLVERYHLGLLDPEEEARFEEHFLGCPECTEELALARSFGRGMKAMAAEDAARAAVIAAEVSGIAGLLVWLARRSRLARAGILLGAVLVIAGIAGIAGIAALPGAWLAMRTARDSERTAAALAASRQSLAGERARAAGLARQLAAQGEERQRLAGQLATIQGTAQGPARPQAAPWNEVLFNTPVFLLRTFREEPQEPLTIDLAKTGGALTLAIDAPADPRFASYHVLLTGAGDRKLFERDGLKPNALEALLLTFPPRFFPPGDYRLKLSGIAADGAPSLLGSYPLRVLGESRRPTPLR